MVLLFAPIPGLVSTVWPAFYRRHREAVVVCSKLLVAVAYPAFRLSWHAAGVPLDVRAAFGGWGMSLPLHPLGLVQSGALLMMSTSIRHPLRMRSQLLCQLVLLTVVLQAEEVRRARCAVPGYTGARPCSAGTAARHAP